MTIEIVDFPIKNGGSFHSYINVHQRVDFHMTSAEDVPIKPGMPPLGSSTEDQVAWSVDDLKSTEQSLPRERW